VAGVHWVDGALVGGHNGFVTGFESRNHDGYGPEVRLGPSRRRLSRQAGDAGRTGADRLAGCGRRVDDGADEYPVAAPASSRFRYPVLAATPPALTAFFDAHVWQ
jgi:hypothetical protein